MDSIQFQVLGEPKSKGSFRAVKFKNQKHSYVINTLKGTKPWQNLVGLVAQRNAPKGGPWTGPLAMVVRFGMPRPKSIGKRVTWHSRRPDADKLLRNVFDALTEIVYADDSQVSLLVCRKEYADAPGVAIKVMRLQEVRPA